MFKRFTQYASKAALVLAVSAMGATTAFAANNTQGTANNANTAYKGTVLVVASSEDKLTMADGSPKTGFIKATSLPASPMAKKYQVK